MPFLGDMLVPWRVSKYIPLLLVAARWPTLAYKTPSLRGSPVPSVTFLNPIPQMWGDVTVRVSSSTECSWDIGWHVDIKQKPSNQSAPIKFNIPNMMGLFPNVSPFKYGVIWVTPMFNRNDIPHVQ